MTDRNARRIRELSVYLRETCIERAALAGQISADLIDRQYWPKHLKSRDAQEPATCTLHEAVVAGTEREVLNRWATVLGCEPGATREEITAALAVDHGPS